MLHFNLKKFLACTSILFTLLFAASVTTAAFTVSSIIFATDAEANPYTESLNRDATPTQTNTKDNNSGGMFSSLTSAGAQIFVGLRDIIFAASGIGIVAVAIGGFFGNLNWKWLAAIGIGLFVLSTTAALIDYMVGTNPTGIKDIQGSLKTGK